MEPKLPFTLQFFKYCSKWVIFHGSTSVSISKISSYKASSDFTEHVMKNLGASFSVWVRWKFCTLICQFKQNHSRSHLLQLSYSVTFMGVCFETSKIKMGNKNGSELVTKWMKKRKKVEDSAPAPTSGDLRAVIHNFEIQALLLLF